MMKSCTLSNSNTCNWSKAFDAILPNDLKLSLVNVGVTVCQPDDELTTDPVLWCDRIAYLALLTYLSKTEDSLELSLVELIEIINPKCTHIPLVVNPDWLLAAWSINLNGNVDGNRPWPRRSRPSYATSPRSGPLTHWTNRHRMCAGA